MLRDLTPAQRKLAEYMSHLSERAYYAGWIDGLEYALWESLIGERTQYGRLAVTDEHRMRLRQLSGECGGWVIFDDDNEEYWVPVSDWRAKFARWKEANARRME